MKLNYTSNLKLKKISSKKLLIKKKIFQNKRLLLWFLIINIIYPNFLISCKFLYKPIKFKKFNILRAPYKNKIAQNSYMHLKYNFSIYFYFPVKTELSNFFFNLLKFLFKNSYFGTNISFENSCNFFKMYKLQI